jgi:hypothetical protein
MPVQAVAVLQPARHLRLWACGTPLGVFLAWYGVDGGFSGVDGVVGDVRCPHMVWCTTLGAGMPLLHDIDALTILLRWVCTFDGLHSVQQGGALRLIAHQLSAMKRGWWM